MAKIMTFARGAEFTATVGERMEGKLSPGRDSAGMTAFLRGNVKVHASLQGKSPTMGIDTERTSLALHFDSLDDLRTLVALIGQAVADLEGSLPTPEG